MRIILAIALLVCATAQADPYAVLGVGVSSTQAAGSTQTTVPAFAGAGFSLNKSIAIEAVYTSLGDHENNSSSTVFGSGGSSTTTNTKTEWSGKGPGIFALWLSPLTPSISLVGKIGAYRLTSETKMTTATENNPNVIGQPITLTQDQQTFSERIWAPSIAVGIQEKSGEHFSIRGMLETVSGHGDFKRATMLSVGVLYSF